MERRQFQTEMEVNGRISVDPTDDWLSARLKAVSSDGMNQQLTKLKDNQRTNAVTDTLAALVTDVNATTEVLRRGSKGHGGADESRRKREEIEYTLRLTPAREEPPRIKSPESDQLEVDDYSRDYGVQMSEETDSLRRRRARSTTPRRTLYISGSPPPPAVAVCAYCSEEIDGPILTALAPNSQQAQKFHTYHFMCTYCQKALNMHGTFREHDRKPYCHDCFYKLYNGLQYAPDDHQATIEKLI
uniref:LIM zinc-binding domain-containing protein n=1 Tax=Caenorhabditis japonica TaxID=281687 RepID=A0A8R1HNX5_CAEJA